MSMFRNTKLRAVFSRRISKAASRAMDDFANGRAQQEAHITDRLIAYLQSEFNFRSHGLSWTAMTLTDRGPGSQEKEFGADFLGSLEINLDGFVVRKGFLAQAKKIEPYENFPSVEFGQLVSQCKKMMQFSPDSFVFLYSLANGITVVPAISVASSRNCNPHELTALTLKDFFRHHFDCFIGDRAISMASASSLDALCELYQARTGFRLTIAAGDRNTQAYQ